MTIKGDILTCKRCGHTWLQRNAKPPVSCPACKSYRWSEPRTNAGISNQTVIHHIDGDPRNNDISNLEVRPG